MLWSACVAVMRHTWRFHIREPNLHGTCVSDSNVAKGGKCAHVGIEQHFVTLAGIGQPRTRDWRRASDAIPASVGKFRR